MGERDRLHFVPAAYIGHFSRAPDLGNLRGSKIAVHRFDPRANFESVVENVEFWRRRARVVLPLVAGAGAAEHDDSRSLEVHALEPVDRLRESPSDDLPAEEWARVAVFIASLFVPYPILDAAMNKRSQDRRFSRGEVEGGYSRNTQRAVSAVLRARWEFVRTPKDLILNDRAVSGAGFRDWALWGYFVPLRKDFGVRIARGPYPKQITWNGSQWRIAIPVAALDDEQTDTLNHWTWGCAAAEVYGSSVRLLAEIDARAPGIVGARDFHDTMVAGILDGSDQERLRDQVLLFSLLDGMDPPERLDAATSIVI